MMLKKLRPSLWLPSIMVAWGIVMTLMGLVQNYHGLLAARIFLGITEAGLFPGVVYYNTMWYCRYEVQVRQAYFFSAASVAGAFSGLLAYGISFMDGVGGLAGWRWYANPLPTTPFNAAIITNRTQDLHPRRHPHRDSSHNRLLRPRRLPLHCHLPDRRRKSLHSLPPTLRRPRRRNALARPRRPIRSFRLALRPRCFCRLADLAQHRRILGLCVSALRNLVVPADDHQGVGV